MILKGKRPVCQAAWADRDLFCLLSFFEQRRRGYEKKNRFFYTKCSFD